MVSPCQHVKKPAWVAASIISLGKQSAAFRYLMISALLGKFDTCRIRPMNAFVISVLLMLVVPVLKFVILLHSGILHIPVWEIQHPFHTVNFSFWLCPLPSHTNTLVGWILCSSWCQLIWWCWLMSYVGGWVPCLLLLVFPITCFLIWLDWILLFVELLLQWMFCIMVDLCQWPICSLLARLLLMLSRIWCHTNHWSSDALPDPVGIHRWFLLVNCMCWSRWSMQCCTI